MLPKRAFLSFKSSSLWYGKSLLPYLVTSLECYVRNCVVGATPMVITGCYTYPTNLQITFSNIRLFSDYNIAKYVPKQFILGFAFFLT